jgi:glucose/arabinose dehydrogenase
MTSRGFQLKFMRLFTLVLLICSLSVSFAVFAQEDEEEEYSVGVELVAEGLTSPVQLVPANDDSNRWFVVDQVGMIRVISADGELLEEPFLDLTGLIVPLRTDYDERGVLGLAFHPDYASNGRFFVYYTAPLRADAPAGWDHTNTLAEFSVSADNPDVGDLASARNVLEMDQPQFNHDAGHIAFGPDGYLYIPIGDGGGGNDTDEGHTPELGNGQDLSNLHGSILRIDVNGEPGDYAIPDDNPFVGQEGVAPEIYAYGLRNPYHISFDRGGDNQLFVADAGQDLYEEVSIVTAGGNYGWNIKEGTHCFDPNDTENPPAECATTGANGDPLIDPIIEYSHDVGVVVVGGYVYRGSAMPDLEGYYIFGDYTASFDGPDGTLLWAEASDEGAMWEWGELSIAGMDDGLGMYVLSLGEGNDGELYVLTSESLAPAGDTGKIWRLVPAGEGAEGGSEAEEPAATEEAGDTGGSPDTGGATPMSPEGTPEA